MIAQELIEFETPGGVLRDGLACHNCKVPCISYALSAPPLVPRTAESGLVAQRYSVAVDNRRICSVVMVLFGVPLVLMTCAVALMQSAGLASQPLTCLALLMGLLFITAKIIVLQSTKLHNLINLRRIPGLPAPASHSRNTA